MACIEWRSRLLDDCDKECVTEWLIAGPGGFQEWCT